ncbi:neurogenic locus Notch -like [Paramuricea clavata]|nr:neurogenic locus Notch -like [Paramuricea clavata]
MTRIFLVILFASLPTKRAQKAKGSCRNANWRSSFDRTGWSKCPATFPYINGLYRSSVSQPSRDYIYLLEQAKCCGNGNSNAECVQADWVNSFDRNNNWNLCPSGYYLSGLYRSSGNNLNNIEHAWCCKPRGAPNFNKSCYNEDVWSKFDWNQQGMVSCTRSGYYITGMYRSSCDYMYCIEEFKCCQLQIKEVCTSVSCLNGGFCLNGTCSCQSGFTGSRCDVDIDECEESPGICQNRANCTNTNGSYACTCTAAYTGRNCSINIDDCKTYDGSSKCLNNGTCIDGEAKFSCECQDTYFGKNCEKNGSKDLFLLSQKEVNISNVVNITKEVKKLSVKNPSHPLQAPDVSNIATILQKIVAVKQKANEISDDICATIDNVLDVSEENVFQSQQDTNSSSRIVKALNDFLETLVIGSSGNFQKVKRNYDLNLQAVQPQNFSGLTFSGIVRNSRRSPLRINDSLTEFNDSVEQASSSSISIPRTIFNESTITNSSRQQRVIFVLYKKTSFFKVSLKDTKKTSSRLNSVVIAGSIKGLSVRNLSNPVKIALVQSGARGDTSSTLCSYWNFTLGNWSQEGCMFQKVFSDGRILCNCNHLTNFAMLMDIKPAVTTKHERILGVISYVGCALSLVGLTLTIITILILR